MAKNVFRAGTPVELIHAIFKHEGWDFVEGESKTAKVAAAFVVTADRNRNQYVARRREDSDGPHVGLFGKKK